MGMGTNYFTVSSSIFLLLSPLPSPPLFQPPLRSKTSEIQVGGLGEIQPQNVTSGGINMNVLPANRLTNFGAVYTVKDNRVSRLIKVKFTGTKLES